MDEFTAPKENSLRNAFIVRIWWEPGLLAPDDRPLWPGRVQHVASGKWLAFQSLDGLLQFLQSYTGDAEYLRFFSNAGWEYLGKLEGWQYFRKLVQPGQEIKIYTDPGTKIQKHRRSLTSFFERISQFKSLL